ncbi:MAG: dihydrofolate reductase [Gammaproteobacteria bacterium]|nr:dihydrofolate reductase [Gammaproteobacteria bacterium]
MKTSVYIATSLDGYIARVDGSLDWLPGSDGQSDTGMEGEDFGYTKFFDDVDVMVMGRNTYQLVRSFGEWPYGEKSVFVLSGSLTDLSVAPGAQVQLKNCTVRELHQELSAAGYRHAYIDGGQTIQGFLGAGLIDDITITRVPILIGSGIPLFGPLSADVRLEHVRTQSYANGFVQSHYHVTRPA